MIYAIIAGAAVLVVFLALLRGLLCAAPQETLDEQAACIRQNQLEREEKKRARAERRRKRA